MAEPTLVQVFGTNATQDIDSLTISKADLVAVGLTAAADNTAESLLTAIFLKAQQYLTQNNFTVNEPDQNITVVSAGTDIVNTGNSDYLRHTLAASFYNPYQVPAIDPDDY